LKNALLRALLDKGAMRASLATKAVTAAAMDKGAMRANLATRVVRVEID
jgi:hypothetical protein